MVLLSTTSFNEFSICPKRYEFHQIDKLVPHPRNLKPIIRRGVWLHSALESHHKGEQWPITIGKMAAWADEHGVPEEQISEMRAEVDQIMQGYIDYWDENGTPFKTLATEKKLYWTTKTGDEIRATLDLITQDRDGIWIWEHKSTQDIPPASWRSIDPQTMLQMMVALANGIEVTGVIFNYLLTKVPSRPRIRKDGEFYAGSEKGLTTSTVWEEFCVEHAEAAAKAGWPGTRITTYQDEWKAKIVSDASFYQRFQVFRPSKQMRLTAMDLQTVLREIKASTEAGYFRRALHPTSCRRFCTYSDLCSLEYVNGGIAQDVRDAEFVLESDEIRSEGR